MKSQAVFQAKSQAKNVSIELPPRIVFLDKAVAELDGSEWGDAKIDLIVAEPNFSMNLLPWHNLLYWYCLKHVSAAKGITDETKVGNLGAKIFWIYNKIK